MSTEVFALLVGEPYEGETLNGVYSTLDLARAAEQKLYATGNAGGWTAIYRVNIDDPPRDRFPTRDDVDSEEP